MTNGTEKDKNLSKTWEDADDYQAEDLASLQQEFSNTYGAVGDKIVARAMGLLGENFPSHEGMLYSLPLMAYNMRLALRKTDANTAYELFTGDIAAKIQENNREAIRHNNSCGYDEDSEKKKLLITLSKEQYPSHADIKEHCARFLYRLRGQDFNRIWEKDSPLGGTPLNNLITDCLDDNAYVLFKASLPDETSDENFTFEEGRAQVLTTLIAKGFLLLTQDAKLSGELRQQIADEVVSSLNIGYKFYDPSESFDKVTVGEGKLQFEVPTQALDYVKPLIDRTEFVVSMMPRHLNNTPDSIT